MSASTTIQLREDLYSVVLIASVWEAKEPSG